jgi:hypothetical protein
MSPRNTGWPTPLLPFGRAVLDAAPEPKEGWFAPEVGHEDLARYGSLDVVVAFIERRLGGLRFTCPPSARPSGSCSRRWIAL